MRPTDFNQYGTRRGNHEVMMRGTFANIRIKNQMVPGVEGGVTKHEPDGELMPIYDAAMRYKAEGVPLVVFAGKEYGTGSSRDWAAKGTRAPRRPRRDRRELRAHPSLEPDRHGRAPAGLRGRHQLEELGLTGTETVSLKGLSAGLKPRQILNAEITFASGEVKQVPLICRIDTLDELEYFRNGGILQYVLRSLVA